MAKTKKYRYKKVTIGTKFYKPINEDEYEIIRVANRIIDEDGCVITTYLDEHDNYCGRRQNPFKEKDFLLEWKEFKPNGKILFSSIGTITRFYIKDTDDKPIYDYCYNFQRSEDDYYQYPIRSFVGNNDKLEIVLGIYYDDTEKSLFNLLKLHCTDKVIIKPETTKCLLDEDNSSYRTSILIGPIVLEGYREHLHKKDNYRRLMISEFVRGINTGFDIYGVCTKLENQKPIKDENKFLDKIEKDKYISIASYDIFKYDPSINLENIKLNYIFLRDETGELFLMLYKASIPRYKADYLTDPDTRDIVNFMLGQK